MKRLLALTVLALLGGISTSFAQVPGGTSVRVVASCGTNTQQSGAGGYLTVDPTGLLCTGGTGGGGSTSVNITAVGGNAVTTSLPVSGSAATNVDNVTPVATGAVLAQSNLMAYDRTTGNWDRVSNVQSQSAGVISPNTGMIATQIYGRFSDTESRAASVASYGNQDTNVPSTFTLGAGSFGLQYDQVLNQWSREGYPSISTTNSSITPLAGGGVFTGTSVNVQRYGSATITVISNVASATNGLSIQQSSDGTNWDITDIYSVAAGVPTKINVPRQAVFLRVIYTNGAGAQASFRLQTLLNTQMPTASSIKPVNGMSLENDFAGVISVPALSNGTSLDVGRSVINATDSIGTGITAVGLVAQLDNTTPSTVTENQFGDLRMSADRSLLTSVQNSYNHISTSTTTTVKSGIGTLKSITVNTLGTVASTATIYDSTTGSGTVIGVINTLALGGTFSFDVQFSTGLTIVTTGTLAPDLTVSYK